MCIRDSVMTLFNCLKRKARYDFIAAVLVAILVCAIGPAFGSKADELIRDADKAAKIALSAKRKTDRDESYKKALELYGKVGGDKMYLGTPQGALALYKMASLQKDMASLQGKKQEHANLYASYETLKRLINIYDKPMSALEENLTRTEAREVRRIVDRAITLKDEVAARLDRLNSVDWKYKVIDTLVAATGRIPSFSYWFAIILITVIVKVMITPLTKAQFKAMKEMQRVAPLVKQIQEQYKGDQKTIGEKTMELYKEHKINPFASCLPLLVQMPILMLLYYTIRAYEFQFARGTFLWIGSGLSHWTSFPVMFNPGSLVWLTAKNLAEPDLILVVLYVISMYVSTKLSAVDPSQAEQQKMMAILMPLMFAFIFAGFPSAFLLYWLVFNILQTVQQYLILQSGRAEAVVPTTVAPVPEQTPKGESSDAEETGIRKSRSRRRRTRR
ncbi:MAG: YidC/Oxa1 family membrane protein insertase, partial [Armatimonadetes bacterium]|nr:YidC/Oxa1 family membrane protein insertase [Armatimonadota bacterium]